MVWGPVVWGPVVWIPIGSPKIKGIGILMATPRIESQTSDGPKPPSNHYPGSPSRPLKEWVATPKTIILVGIYFINNSKGRTYFNGRLDFQGLAENQNPSKKHQKFGS